MPVKYTKRSDTLNKNDSKIWIWIQDNKLFKAVCNPLERSLTIYNENDEILVQRKGLTPNQIKTIEIVFSKKGAKRIDGNQEPFTYL